MNSCFAFDQYTYVTIIVVVVWHAAMETVPDLNLKNYLDFPTVMIQSIDNVLHAWKQNRIV